MSIHVKCYTGYYLMLVKNSKIRLDKDLYPIIRSPKQLSSKDKLGYVNANRMFEGIPERAIPAFMISNCISYPGKFPYILVNVGNTQRKKYRQNFLNWIREDIDEEFDKITKENTLFDLLDDLSGNPKILEDVLNGEISVLLFLKLCKEYNVPLKDYDMSNSIKYSKIKGLLDVSHDLNCEYNIVNYFKAMGNSLLKKDK